MNKGTWTETIGHWKRPRQHMLCSPGGFGWRLQTASQPSSPTHQPKPGMWERRGGFGNARGHVHVRCMQSLDSQPDMVATKAPAAQQHPHPDPAHLRALGQLQAAGEQSLSRLVPHRPPGPGRKLQTRRHGSGSGHGSRFAEPPPLDSYQKGKSWTTSVTPALPTGKTYLFDVQAEGDDARGHGLEGVRDRLA